MTLTEATNTPTFNYEIFYWILLIALVLGGILFFISCFIHVKKGYIAIIERMEIYYGTYKKGFYLFAPFIYRRVGMYQIAPKEMELTICGSIILIKIQINDFKTYHYSKTSYISIVEKIKETDFDSIETFVKTLQLELNKIGCSLVK